MNWQPIEARELRNHLRSNGEGGEMKMKWMLVPVIEPLNPVNVWEHTPLDPWKSEYPRFIRPVRFEGKTEWRLVPVRCEAIEKQSTKGVE